MPPRFPKPLDVKNAVERRATLRIRWEKDAKLLLLVIKLIESDASNRELSVLSRRIRHEPETRSLVPSTGLSRWLRKEQWKPFFEIYSVPVDTKQNKTADDDVNPKPLPPPLTMLKPLYCHPDADYLEQLKIGKLDSNAKEELPEDPDAILYTPDAAVTAKQARKMKIPFELEKAIYSDIYEFNKKLSLSRERANTSWTRVKNLQAILKTTTLENLEVNLFGSSINGLCSATSDIDLSITSDEIKAVLETKDKNATKNREKGPIVDIMNEIVAVLRKNNMLNVTSISQARIPVIKFEHPPDNQPIDIALANQVAIRNTALFHAYTKADPRVRPLIMAIKYWASRRVISEAALNGNIINSYTHVLMMIAYLQRMRVVPPLQRICCGKFLTKIMAPRMTNPNPQNISNRVCLACGKLMPDVVMVDGYNTYFYEKTLAEKSPNPMSAAKLLVEFFRYYAFEFNYETECVSVRQGTTIDREAKGWRDYGPGDGDKSHALCVEDPFVLERNTAVSARRWTIAGIRWEYERAARGLLSGRGLEAVCTPWQEWPITQYDDMNIYGDQ